MTNEKAVAEKLVATFLVDGITCLDCARKFEQMVGKMPGVTTVSLNAMTRKLTIEGRADLEAIRRLGLEENYTIHPEAGQAAPAAGQHDERTHWELRRAILSGAALVIAYGAERFGGSGGFYLSLYVAAVALGGWGNFRKAARALPRGNFTMSVLMSVAVLGAMAIGQYEEGATVAFCLRHLKCWKAGRWRKPGAPSGI